MRVSLGLALLISVNAIAQDSCQEKEAALREQFVRELRRNTTEVDNAAIREFV